MTTAFIAEYKTEIIAEYRQQKATADAALARVDEQAFFKRLGIDGDEHTNSIAILVKHLGGNLRSMYCSVSRQRSTYIHVATPLATTITTTTTSPNPPLG